MDFSGQIKNRRPCLRGWLNFNQRRNSANSHELSLAIMTKSSLDSSRENRNHRPYQPISSTRLTETEIQILPFIHWRHRVSMKTWKSQLYWSRWFLTFGHICPFLKCLTLKDFHSRNNVFSRLLIKEKKTNRSLEEVLSPSRTREKSSTHKCQARAEVEK